MTVHNELLTPEEKNWVKNHPVIRSTNKNSTPPNEFIRAGKPVGFSVDYLNLVAKNVGLKIDYVYGYPWAELLEKLKRREIDISHNIFLTEERKSYLNFTRPYLDLEPAFFGRTGSAPIENIDDLEGKKIGVVKGWALNNAYKQKYPNLNFVELDTSLEAVLGLSEGKIDVYIATLFIANGLIAKNFISNVEVIGKTDFLEVSNNEGARIAVRNDWPVLYSIIQKGMTSITQEQYNSLAEKWLLPTSISNNLDLTLEEINWLQNNPEIRVVVDPSITPVEFIDEDGKISGIAGTFLDIISMKLNVKFKWIRNQSLDEGLDKLRHNEADIVSALVPTEERKKYLSFTDSYMDLNVIIFGQEGKNIYGDMDGLNGHIVAMPKGFYLNEKLVRDYPDIKVIEVPTKADALNLVSAGIADAHLGSVPLTSHTLVSEGLTNDMASGVTPFTGDISIAVRSDLPLLESALQKAMKSISKSERRKILNDWIVLQTDAPQNYELVFQILAGAGCILLLILIWNFSLRQEVRRRKFSEERFRQIAETVNGLFFICSPDLKEVRYISPNFEEWTGKSSQNLYNDPTFWYDFIHPADRTAVKQEIKASVKNKFTSKFPDFRIIDGKNNIRWVSLQANSVLDDNGQITGIVGMMNDVTARVESRTKLSEIRNQFQNAFTHASHGMALVSLEGKFLRVNDAYCNILGYENHELLELDIEKITHPDDKDISRKLLRELVSGKRISFQLEKKCIHKNGKFIPMQLSVSMVRDDNNEPVHFVSQVQDLSALKEREEQLRHSQKMDAVGKLTGGIAHDFNNILGIILGNLEILKTCLPNEKKTTLRLDKAIKGVDRGSSLIKKLLSFSRKTSMETGTISVNESVLNLKEVIKRTFSASIELKTCLDDGLWPVCVDEGDLEDAILNLALNARDAMPGGGHIVVTTKNVILDDDFVEQNPGSRKGEHVVLSISDTGTGIAPDVIDKVLEPFFTTKPVNKGTGLGLSMVHGFVQRSKGYMKIFSELGRGTEFSIYIPRTYKKLKLADGFMQEVNQLPTGSETILVVEDEKNLCDVAQAHLTDLGYSVFTANTASGALEILSKKKKVDLLFSDIVMPDNQDGYEIASSALKIRPSIKILLASGYTHNLEQKIKSGDSAIENLAQNLLQKPYNRHELAIAVRRSLDQ